MRAYIGLGSNLGDGPAIIRAALAGLDRYAQIQGTRVSSFYRSAAWGCTDQPDFTNAVAALETGVDPPTLLAICQSVEQSLGRERPAVRWGPRIIDIDLLCCGDYVSQQPELQLPHPLIHLRAFVMVPLLELEPELVLPGIGPLRACLDKVQDQPVQILR